MKDFGSQIKYVGGNEGDKCNYSARLDTYGCGCQHDCSYCYAKSLLNFRGLWNPKSPAVGDISKISYDVQLRLSPFIPDFMDLDKLSKLGIDKILVEFLRVNHWIRAWLDGKCDLSEYTRTFHGYDHLPFEKKKEYVDKIRGSSVVTVCDF